MRIAEGHLYLALPRDLADYACTRLGRDLTEEEWAHYMGSDLPYRPTCP